MTVYMGKKYDCTWHRDMDKKFGTESNSPLHHDNRCPIHTTNVRFRKNV